MASTRSRSIRPFLLPVVLLSACQTAGRPPETGVASPPGGREAASPALHPLDEDHSDAFRTAFDEGRELDRYVVALSPT